jgi:hypothetical protein
MKRFAVTPKKAHIRLAGVGLVLSLLALPPVTGAIASAATTPPTNTVAQSYSAGPDVLTGMLVQPKDQSTVIPVDTGSIHKMSGVVIPINGAEIVLTPPNTQSRQVLVASTGRYNMLVSNQNGPVKTGDYLTISALAGIAMKAGPEQPEVVGRAVGNFDGKGNVVDTVKLKSDDGHSSTAAVGYVQTDIRLAPNPLSKNSNYVPGILDRAAQSITNKPVSAAKIYLSIAVMVATFFITGSMVYGGMRGSMTAIGRNPLAKGVISRGMVQSVIFGLIVFLLGILAAYGLLL